MTDLNYLKSVIKNLENSYESLEQSRFIKSPKWDSDSFGFRYKKRSDLLLIFLQGVRWVSLLNASIVLLEAGHVHEMGILFRCMDESAEDIFFFADARGPKGQVFVNQQRALA